MSEGQLVVAFDIARKVGIASVNTEDPDSMTSHTREFPLWVGRPKKSHRNTQAETLHQWMEYLEDFFVNEMKDQVDVVAFEELTINAHTVRRMSGDWLRIYCGMRGILLAMAEKYLYIWIPFPMQTIKKRATDNGNASKEMIMEYSGYMWPHDPPADDNQADARWCAILACETLENQDEQ